MPKPKYTLTVALLQADLVWENPLENRQRFAEKIRALPAGVDLVLLPEMFTTGFTMRAAQNAETTDGETVAWMRSVAREGQLAVAGSLIIAEDGQFYNRLLFVLPTGQMYSYDKRHLFALAGEQNIYASGKEKVVFEYLGWKICPMICYDLRFPVWNRNAEGYDLLFFVANWPSVRVRAWDTLLQARAIENVTYCLGVNRVGVDGNGFPHCGHTAAFDALGENLCESFPEEETTLLVTLSKDHLDKVRSKHRFLDDADGFRLK